MQAAHATRLVMTLKNLANIFILTLWISIQVVMTFSHPAMAGEMSHGQTASSSISTHHAQGSLNKMHSHAADIVHDDRTINTHHNQASLDECCDSACSVVGGIFAGSFCNLSIALIVGSSLIQANKTTHIGLPTPPPDTII